VNVCAGGGGKSERQERKTPFCNANYNQKGCGRENGHFA
jgi:hypothetical protein